jgi:hypothetical protein
MDLSFALPVAFYHIFFAKFVELCENVKIFYKNIFLHFYIANLTHLYNILKQLEINYMKKNTSNL